MKINKIYVENFGCLTHYEKDFVRGLNTIEEENGFGKTTLANFIKAMFYGFSGNKKSIADNDRLHYAPWNGGKFGGYLEFEHQGNTYRIERFFDSKSSTKDSFKLYNVLTKKESKDFTKNIGEELFGIDVSGFMHTIYIPQNNVEWTINNNIASNLTNMLESSSDTIDYDSAIAKLKEKEREYVKMGNRGKIADTENQINAYNHQLEEAKYALKNVDELKVKITNEENIVNKLQTKIKKIREQIKVANEQKEKIAIIKYYQRIKENLKNTSDKLQEIEDKFNGQVVTQEKLDQKFIEYRKYQSLVTKYNELNQADLSTKEYFRLKEELHFNETEDLTIEQLNDLKNKNDQYRLISKQQIDISKTMDELDNQLANETITAPRNQIVYILLTCLSAFLLIPGIVLLFTNPTLLIFIFGIIMTAVGGALLLFGVLMLVLQKTKNVKIVNVAKAHQKELEERKQELGKEYRELEQNASIIKQELKNFVDKYGLENSRPKIFNELAEIIEEDNDIYSPVIDKVKENLKLYVHFKEIYQQRIEKTKEIQEELQKLKVILEDFIGKYDGIDLLVSLNKIQHDINIYEASKKDYFNYQQELEAYTEKNKIDFEQKLVVDEALDIVTLEQNQSGYEYELDNVKTKIARLNQELDKANALVDTIVDIETKLISLNEELETFKYKYEVVQKTIEYLTIAKEKLSTTYLSTIQTQFNYYLNKILVNQNYDFSINSNLEIINEENSELKELDYYSSGYQDIVIFCARLSLVSSIYKTNTPCLILDDPFTNYDDSKLSMVQKLLQELQEQYQIIYMVCHSSRKI